MELVSTNVGKYFRYRLSVWFLPLRLLVPRKLYHRYLELRPEWISAFFLDISWMLEPWESYAFHGWNDLPYLDGTMVSIKSHTANSIMYKLTHQKPRSHIRTLLLIIGAMKERARGCNNGPIRSKKDQNGAFWGVVFHENNSKKGAKLFLPPPPYFLAQLCPVLDLRRRPKAPNLLILCSFNPTVKGIWIDQKVQKKLGPLRKTG